MNQTNAIVCLKCGAAFLRDGGEFAGPLDARYTDGGQCPQCEGILGDSRDVRIAWAKMYSGQVRAENELKAKLAEKDKAITGFSNALRRLDAENSSLKGELKEKDKVNAALEETLKEMHEKANPLRAIKPGSITWIDDDPWRPDGLHVQDGLLQVLKSFQAYDDED